MMRIFLTIGTHEPFDRLVKAVDDWCGGAGQGVEVFGQITDRAGHAPRHFSAVAKLAPADYRARCEAAGLIVSHAGMGSIITALTFRKPILVMPRRGHLRETRNDHQWATVGRLETRPGIHVARDETELPACLDRLSGGDGVADMRGISPHADRSLTDALRALILG